jgi:hypothetical protein
MGIETLYSAAYAAGFAMAAPEEAYEDLVALPMPASASLAAELPWQPDRGVLVYEKTRATPRARSDWMGVLLGLFGRRSPTRRPVLTAEA